MKTLLGVVLCALTAPAFAADWSPRTRAGIDVGLTFGAERPLSLGVAVDQQFSPREGPVGLVLGGGFRAEILGLRAVQVSLEPTVGYGILTHNHWGRPSFAPHLVPSLRTPLALHSTKGLRVGFAADLEGGPARVPFRARFTGYRALTGPDVDREAIVDPTVAIGVGVQNATFQDCWSCEVFIRQKSDGR